MPRQMDEEAKLLLRRIVESQAYRQLAAMNILGHCLKFIGELDAKMRATRELDASLHIFREVRALYRELGWEDLESAVRDRMDRIPYPETRIEFSICRFLCDTAERVAMEAYTESSSPQFAAIALSYLELSRDFTSQGEGRFEQFCEEEGNRPRAQELFNRWLAVSLLSFGRPNTRDDKRAVEIGLRSRSSAEMTSEFVTSVRPFAEDCGLVLPDAETLGLELPPEYEALVG